MPKNILVIGASGYIGRHLVPLLLSKKHHVKATARKIETLEYETWASHNNIELIELDLLSSPNLTALLNNIDIVFFLVHGMSHGHDFIDIELTAAKRLSHALHHSKVNTVIYLGALQPSSNLHSMTTSHSSLRSIERSQHLHARKETGDILRDSGITTIELRAGIIIGPGSAAFEVMRDFVQHLPILVVPKDISNRNAIIALPNLLHYLVELIQTPPPQHAIYDVPSAESLTYQQQLKRLSTILNQHPPIIRVPLFPLRAMQSLLSITTSVPNNIARALMAGLSHDLYTQDSQLQTRYPQSLLNYDEAVRLALKQEQKVVQHRLWGFDKEALVRWQPNYGYYPKQAGFTYTTTATAESLWKTIQTIGKPPYGYFYGNRLWQCREWIDRRITTIWPDTVRRLKPLESQTSINENDNETGKMLHVGDQIESWKVIEAKENTHLTLLFGMKAPGLGRFTCHIKDDGDYRKLDIRAWWHPAGFWGLLYWFVLMPAHLFLFKGMAKKISSLSQ